MTASTTILRTMTVVEVLAWTYRDQLADVMTGKGLSAPEAAAMDEDPENYHGGWGGCGCAAMETIGALGVIIPGTSSQQRPALHPDAEAVHDAVVALSAADWMGAALLRRWGRRGEAPDWCRDMAQWYERVRRPDDDAHVDDRFDEVSVVKGRVVPHRYCPVSLYPPNEWFDLARGEYRTWFRAVQRLEAALGGCRFVRVRLSGLGAMPAPWEQGGNEWA